MACIYTLSSSLDPGVIRYVGRSKKDSPETRFKAHLREAKVGYHSAKTEWINDVLKNGGKIICKVLESDISEEESIKQEIYYIAKYRNMHGELTNVKDGGGSVKPRARLLKKESEELKPGHKFLRINGKTIMIPDFWQASIHTL